MVRPAREGRSHWLAAFLFGLFSMVFWGTGREANIAYLELVRLVEQYPDRASTPRTPDTLPAAPAGTAAPVVSAVAGPTLAASNALARQPATVASRRLRPVMAIPECG